MTCHDFPGGPPPIAVGFCWSWAVRTARSWLTAISSDSAPGRSFRSAVSTAVMSRGTRITTSSPQMCGGTGSHPYPVPAPVADGCWNGLPRITDRPRYPTSWKEQPMSSAQDRYLTKSDAPGAEPTETHDTAAEGSAALIDPAEAAFDETPPATDETNS
jgi:hypothetical protein